MNYLAHFYLADPELDLTFGNYIGDGVKGSDLARYSDKVQRGIRFHRFIDSYTDDHKLVREAKKLFYPSQAKYSGVVTDVLFDHLLAINWSQYSNLELTDFAAKCYQLISDYPEEMPLRSARFYQYMTSNNILEGYATLKGIQQVFDGMDSRTKFYSNMGNSIVVLDKHFSEISRLFEGFFPELKQACSIWKTSH